MVIKRAAPGGRAAVARDEGELTAIRLGGVAGDAAIDEAVVEAGLGEGEVARLAVDTSGVGQDEGRRTAAGG